jgi:hypothetical protein
MRFTLKVNPHMTDFIVKKLPYDLNSHASLAFIGKYLKRINVNALIALGFPTARFLKATLPCCAWARAISMLFGQFAICARCIDNDIHVVAIAD